MSHTEFEETIKKAFASDGRFTDIRGSLQRQAVALAQLVALGNAQLVVPLPEGEEQQEVGFAIDELADKIENFLNEDYQGDAAEDVEADEAAISKFSSKNLLIGLVCVVIHTANNVTR